MNPWVITRFVPNRTFTFHNIRGERLGGGTKHSYATRSLARLDLTLIDSVLWSSRVFLTFLNGLFLLFAHSAAIWPLVRQFQQTWDERFLGNQGRHVLQHDNSDNRWVCHFIQHKILHLLTGIKEDGDKEERICHYFLGRSV
jgi:hypothetical protein